MEKLEACEIKYLKGVGEKRSEILANELGVHNFRDLIYYFPFRHIDRSRFYKIKEFTADMPMVQVRGRFVSFLIEGEGARKRLLGIFSDGERLMQAVWFSKVNALKDVYKTGKEYVLFGKPASFRGGYSMAHPEVSEYNPSNPPQGFQGVYNITDNMRKKGYTPRFISGLVKTLLSHPLFSQTSDTLPSEVVEAYHLMPWREAVANMHFPKSPDHLAKARERMKFEELFYLQLHILRYARARSRRIRGLIFGTIGDYFNGFYKKCLPFELTGAQKRVLKEIRADMRTGHQMNRLLQGDVGSGKTMVAFMSMLMAADNGYQGALMAPTEILATQHYETLSEWGRQIGINVRLLTGSTRAAERREIHAGLTDGSIHIIVGTHALIEDSVSFRNLGLVVIDEQHRFGVAQRAKMWAKNTTPPHVLVMTATPIPRTLAMTVYGDLDVSVIDELPPGREPVDTRLRFEDNRMDVIRLMERELAAGRQAYVVFPLISDNPKLELKSVEAGYDRICETFPAYKACCVHGRMKPDVKEAQMQKFISGEARILVATTVIEVGVNVPNASVMLIENAERFGLSQLHQLRGRVGRGADRSYCVLLTKQNIGRDTRKRLDIMTQTTDGFLISEADMRLRGPGDMEGTQQSGLAFALNVANLATDGQVLNYARQAALRILNARPELAETSADDCDRSEGTLEISDRSTDTLRKELRYRFMKSVDWSQIS